MADSILTLEAEVTVLTDKWMNTIAGEHHKDRDCHWHIVRIWSYGNEPYWELQHYGYLEDQLSMKCVSYRAALGLLKLKLKGAIERWSGQKEESEASL